MIAPFVIYKSTCFKHYNNKLKNRDEGIRTLGGVAPAQSFQDCTLNHSDTSLSIINIIKPKQKVNSL